jgi:HPt (histidine-containing phosphotransfer) domain-containing protein
MSMQSDQENAPAAAVHADHEVITPPNTLRKAIKPGPPRDDDPVARAEQALADLSSEFSGWMQDECDRLDRARHQIAEIGLNAETQELLFHAAHDIKGEAATFGFPEVAVAAESLCRLIEHTPSMEQVPLPLVEQHVEAIRAIIREHSQDDAEALARSLTQRLREVTDEFLVRENKNRPEHLEAILGPTLIPR